MCMLNYREGNYDIRSFFDTTKMVSVFFVILGNVLYALTVKLFLLPADLVTGGTTGIGLAVNHYTGLSISGFVLVFNIIMLLAGFIILGKQFALTTIISTFVYPVRSVYRGNGYSAARFKSIFPNSGVCKLVRI